MLSYLWLFKVIKVKLICCAIDGYAIDNVELFLIKLINKFILAGIFLRVLDFL